MASTKKTDSSVAPETAEVETTVTLPEGAIENIERAVEEVERKAEQSKSRPRIQPETLVEELASVTDAARTLGVSLGAVNHYVKTGRLASLKVGSATILMRWSVEALKAEREAAAPEAARLKELRYELRELKAKMKK